MFPLYLGNSSALPGKTWKLHLFTQMYYIFGRVQPVAAWFLQFCWLATHAAVDSLILVVNWVQLWPVGAVPQKKWNWEFCAAAVELCCVHHVLVHAWAVLLKGKQYYHWEHVWSQLTFVEIVRYPSNTVHWLFTWGSTKNNSHFWHSNRRHDRLGERWVCGNGW